MARTKLTDRFVDSITPPIDGRDEYADSLRIGLRLRVSSAGSKTWCFEKRIKNGPKRKHTLGPYPAISVADARAMSAELELEAIKGIDRVADAAKALKAAELAASQKKTVREALDTYELEISSLRTKDALMRGLRNSLSKHLDSDLNDVTRKDLQGIISAKMREGYLTRANRIRLELSGFLNWAWREELIADKLAERLQPAGKEVSRERVLSIAELQLIWQKSYNFSELFGPLVRLLVLTVQRKSIIAKLTWDEVQFNTRRIELSGTREKNAHGHITHLSEPALVELQQLYERSEKKSGYVFTTTGSTPVSGFSKAKGRLDKLLGEEFNHWTLHDIRTAFSTTMCELGEPESTVDRILNHVASGSAPSATARVYNRAQLLPERARILERWAGIVTGRTAEIVRFGG